MNERMPAEMELVKRAKLKEKAALEQLVLLYIPLIQSLARRFRMNNNWTEELKQAGIVGLLQAVESFDLDLGNRLITYAFPWILGEMKRLIRDAPEFNQRQLSYEYYDEQQDCCCDWGNLESKAEKIDLHDAIRSLPDRERAMIEMRYHRDKTQKETAEELKMSQSQVSKLERRTLEHLRIRLCDHVK